MIKPQDIIVLIKLHIWNQGRWKIVPLAESIFLSQSETHAAIERLKLSSLFDEGLERTRSSDMEEFFIHGFKYCFPAEIGPIRRGIPTSHSAPIFEKQIVSQETYVWPHAKGKNRGLSVKPLYKTAPEASLADLRMYNYLALLDALRIGKAREQAIAKEKLLELIKLGNTYHA